MRSNKPKRLVLCQGITQLVAAFSAIRQSSDSQLFEDRIVFFDHISPSYDEEDVLRVANVLGGRLSPLPVLHLSTLELKTLKDLPWRQSVSVARELLGGIDPTELYLGREWLWGNEFFIKAFPKARKICYGDALGIYYSEKFATPDGIHPSVYFSSDGTRAHWRQRFDGWLKRQNLKFDEAYLLQPGTFEIPPTKVVHAFDVSVIRKLLDELGQSELVRQALRKLPEAPTAILLTSNCSESYRISLENELQGYTERVLQNPPRHRECLWIKPHPREKTEKLDLLARRMKETFENVYILEGDLALLPFEILWSALRRDWEGLEHPTIYSFGATTVSLSRVFNLPTEFGFGERRVRELYLQPHRSVRIRFENAVSAAVFE